MAVHGYHCPLDSSSEDYKGIQDFLSSKVAQQPAAHLLHVDRIRVHSHGTDSPLEAITFSRGDGGRTRSHTHTHTHTQEATSLVSPVAESTQAMGDAQMTNCTCLNNSMLQQKHKSVVVARRESQ